MISNLRKTCSVALLVAAIGCAAAPRPRTETARIKDSAPERAAAQRSADRSLGLETEEQRWGIAAARERREGTDRKKKEVPPVASGSVDLRRGPGASAAADQTAR